MIDYLQGIFVLLTGIIGYIFIYYPPQIRKAFWSEANRKARLILILYVIDNFILLFTDNPLFVFYSATIWMFALASFFIVFCKDAWNLTSPLFPFIQLLLTGGTIIYGLTDSNIDNPELDVWLGQVILIGYLIFLTLFVIAKKQKRI